MSYYSKNLVCILPYQPNYNGETSTLLSGRPFNQTNGTDLM